MKIIQISPDAHKAAKVIAAVNDTTATAVASSFILKMNEMINTGEIKIKDALNTSTK